jgi:TonB family protein
MRRLVFRIIPALGAVTLGGLCAFCVLALVLKLNREPSKRDKEKSPFTASFEVRKQKKKKKDKKKIRRRKPPQRARRVATAPAPVVGVGLSGIDFGLPAVSPDGLGDLTGSLLDAKKDLRDVVMTKEAVDQLPRPTVRSKPAFPPRLRKQGVMRGVVVVSLLIGTDGSVQNIKVLSSTHELFERAVLEAVPKWRFEPGRYKGQAVPLSMRQTIRFQQS